jgi:hypothetical protein
MLVNSTLMWRSVHFLGDRVDVRMCLIYEHALILWPGLIVYLRHRLDYFVLTNRKVLPRYRISKVEDGKYTTKHSS